MKLRAVLVVGLVLAAASASAAEFPCWGLVKAEDVYVRSGPDKSYRDLGALAEEALVRVLDVSGDGRWFRIVPPESADVWISARYVKVDGERGVVTGDRVWVRARPELTGEQVNQLNKGAVLKVKVQQGEWLKIAPPENTEAWVSADYVRKMTEADVAALSADRARREVEEKQRRTEAARRKLEAELVASADALLGAELARPIQARALNRALLAYQDAGRQVKDAALAGRIQAKIALVQAMQAVQAALQAKAYPPALPRLDYARLRADAATRREAEELLTAHALAVRAADEARRPTEPPRSSERRLDGWVSVLAPGLDRTGATHQLTKSGRAVALLKSDQVDLGSFLGLHVQVAGSPAGGAAATAEKQADVIDVAKVELVFDY